MIGIRIRGLATTVLFNVWTKRSFPSDALYRKFRRRDWNSYNRDAECVSPYPVAGSLPSKRLGIQDSISIIDAFFTPRSPVQHWITRYGRFSRFKNSSAYPSISACQRFDSAMSFL